MPVREKLEEVITCPEILITSARRLTGLYNSTYPNTARHISTPNQALEKCIDVPFPIGTRTRFYAEVLKYYLSRK